MPEKLLRAFLVDLIPDDLKHKTSHRLLLLKALVLLHHCPPKPLSNTLPGPWIFSPEFLRPRPSFFDSGDWRRQSILRPSLSSFPYCCATPAALREPGVAPKRAIGPLPKLAGARASPAAYRGRTRKQRTPPPSPSSPPRRAAGRQLLHLLGGAPEWPARPLPCAGAAVFFLSGELLLRGKKFAPRSVRSKSNASD